MVAIIAATSAPAASTNITRLMRDLLLHVVCTSGTHISTLRLLPLYKLVKVYWNENASLFLLSLGMLHRKHRNSVRQPGYLP